MASTNRRRGPLGGGGQGAIDDSGAGQLMMGRGSLMKRGGMKGRDGLMR